MRSSRVLHISNDFTNSELYKQLAIHLDEAGVKQTIYSAVRTIKEAAYNPAELENLPLHFRYILKNYHRLLFRLKIRNIYNDLTSVVSLSEIALVHAHTLHSDGAVALKIKRNFNIPYIVAVRSTDLYSFMNYRPDLKWRRNAILMESKKIIFLSSAHREKFFRKIGERIKQNIQSKAITVPNGIAPAFLQSVSLNKRKENPTLKILYVGSFIKRKNVQNLIQAVSFLSRKRAVSLTLVGGGGSEDYLIKKMINKEDFSFVCYKGKVANREKLREIYRAHDIFAMVSDRETFGLVYIEALSQGLPIVYTKGEGIDGYFKEGSIGEAVNDSGDIHEIATKMDMLANKLDANIREECIKEAQRFNWPDISRKYVSIYNSILS